MMKKTFSCFVALLLLCSLFTHAVASISSSGKASLQFWIYAFDSIFHEIKENVGEQISMICLEESLGMPEGVILIDCDLQFVATQCNNEHRAYYIDNDTLFHQFAALAVCNSVLSANMLSEGVEVYFIIDGNTMETSEADIEFYISSIDSD